MPLAAKISILTALPLIVGVAGVMLAPREDAATVAGICAGVVLGRAVGRRVGGPRWRKSDEDSS